MSDKVVAMAKKADNKTGIPYHEYFICDYKTTVQEIYNKLANGSRRDIVISFGVREKGEQ